MKQNRRKVFTGIVAAVLAAAAVAAVVMVPKMKQEPVTVISVGEVSYPGYGTGGGESFGQVVTDKVQTIFVSGTQVVTEIMVYEGQEVKKGDVLFTYDTTLSDLALERKDLAIQQLQMTLKDAKKELTRLNRLKPMVIPKPTDPPPTQPPKEEDLDISPKEREKLNTAYHGEGTLKKPFYFWLSEKEEVTQDMIELLLRQLRIPSDTVYVVFQMTENDKTDTPFYAQYGVKYTREEIPGEVIPPDTEPEETEPEETEPEESTAPEPTEPEPTVPETTQPEPTEPETTAPEATDPAPTEPEQTEPSEPAVPEPSGDPAELPEQPGEGTAAAEPAVRRTYSVRTEKPRYRYRMAFFDYTKIDEIPDIPTRPEPDFDMGSGYTQTELVAMRNQKKAEIKELEFNIKMGKAELKIMKKEAADGSAKADFDGVVVSVVEPLAAREQNVPMIKVAGGGGYYVEGSVTELELESGLVQVGQNVTINSWDNGMIYEGTIAEIGRYPVENQDVYGAANMSYYPYKVFIDESADLMEGSYVSMSYQTDADFEGQMYLDNAFLLSEGKRSYVYVRGAEGRLEKRYVQTGASQDGYATPVLAGLTEADFIAFPYGKHIKEGAPTAEGTMEDLYKG